MTDRTADTTRTGWGSFVVERLALPPLLLMATALAASVQILAAGRVAVAPMALAVAGITGLLALLRLMDDVKDLDRDRIAHPDRPLARGALSRGRAEAGVRAGAGALLVGALGTVAAGLPTAGALLALCVVWALLMYREFFLHDLLDRRPVLYAVSHQVIVFPIFSFAAAVTGPAAARSPDVWWFAAAGLGVSFTWEVCRKLDPKADPVLATYAVRLGPRRAVGLAVAALFLVFLGADRLGLEWIVWPLGGSVLAALLAVLVRPSAYRWAAGAAGALAAIHPAAPLLGRWWGLL